MFKYFPSFDAPMQRYSEAAAPYAQVWRLILGLALIITFYLALGSIFLATAVWIAAEVTGAASDPSFASANELSRLADSAGGTQILLASFGVLWIAIWFVLRLVHGRGFGTLLSHTARFNFVDFGRGLGIALLFAGGTAALSAVVLNTPIQALSLVDWLPFLIPALILLVLQVGAEELLFRGYIQQQLAARFRHPIVWALIPSLIFGVVHYSPETLGPLTWPVMASAALAGFLFATITARTGNIAGAMGVHYGINVSALMIIGHPNHLGGMALFHWSINDEALMAMVAIDIVALLLVFPLALRVFGSETTPVRQAEEACVTA